MRSLALRLARFLSKTAEHRGGRFLHTRLLLESLEPRFLLIVAAGQHALTWSTYLGGSDWDSGAGIAVDAAGNAFVTGATSSPGWVSGGFDTTYGGVSTITSHSDTFVVKLSAAGAHLWSTYLGGSDWDSGRGIAVDATGNAFVTGFTQSPGWVSGGFDTTYASNDAFVAKLSPAGEHLWSTYLGSGDDDDAYGIAVDSAGNALVAGYTYSAGYGYSDAFVTKLSPSGGRLWTTHIGGNYYDAAWGIAVDTEGNALVTGQTQSLDWTSGSFDTTYNGTRDAFVAKLSPSGIRLWSTYLGGSERDEGLGIAVDAAGNALVTGYTDSSGWVSGGFDTTYNGFTDPFVVKLSPSGAHLWSTYLDGSSGNGITVDPAGNVVVTGGSSSNDASVVKLSASGAHLWSTSLGGNNRDRGDGIAVDSTANVLVTGLTLSSGWISGGFDTTRDGDFDAFVAKISDLTTTFSRHDAAVLAHNLGRTSGATVVEGDLTGDGRVDLADLAFLQGHLVNPAASPAAGALAVVAGTSKQMAVDAVMATHRVSSTPLIARRRKLPANMDHADGHGALVAESALSSTIEGALRARRMRKERAKP